jgi:PRTRC genetic system ThiF family protein
VTLSGKLPVILSLDNYPEVEEILIVGCGGTGAYVISHLARLLSVVNRGGNSRRRRRYGRYNDDLKLYLADGDIVEEKNLTRQHFIHQDIDRNKAEVLGERYSAAFGIQIGVIPKDLEKPSDLKFLSLNGNGSTVVVGCVDNNASRKVIREWFLGTKDGSPDNVYHHHNWSSKFWIDSGNEERNGQVVCAYRPSTRGFYGTNKINPFKVRKSQCGEFSLPCATEIYPNLMEGDTFNSQTSCAENAESAPQNMQTNVTAATIIMNFLNKIIIGEPIKSHCVEFSINNSFTTRLNTPENLSIVDVNRRRHWEK